MIYLKEIVFMKPNTIYSYYTLKKVEFKKTDEFKCVLLSVLHGVPPCPANTPSPILHLGT